METAQQIAGDICNGLDLTNDWLRYFIAGGRLGFEEWKNTLSAPTVLKRVPNQHMNGVRIGASAREDI